MIEVLHIPTDKVIESIKDAEAKVRNKQKPIENLIKQEKFLVVLIINQLYHKNAIYILCLYAS